MTTRDELIADLVRERIWVLKNLIREQHNLSRPVPPGRWRWADVHLDGYTPKSETERANDQARAAKRLVALREELATLTGTAPESTEKEAGTP